MTGVLRSTSPFQTVAITFWLFDRGFGYATVGFAVAVPIFCSIAGSAVGGWLSDRSSPLVLLSQLNAVLVAAAIGVYICSQFASDRAQPIIGAAALYALVNGASGPAERSLTPRLLTRPDYQLGNSVFGAVTNVSAISGPLFGGFVFALGGIRLAIGLNVAALSIGAVALFLVARLLRVRPGAEHAPTSPQSFARSLSEAIRLVSRSRWLILLLGLDAVMDLVTSGQFQVGFRILANRGGGALMFGMMMAAYGVGAVIGATLGGRFRLPNGRAYRLTIGCNLAQAPVIALLPFFSAPALLTALVPIGVVNGLANVVYMTLLFRNIPEAMAGRMSAFFLISSLSLQPLGVLFFGWTAAAGHVAGLFAGSSLVMIVTSIAAIPLWRRFGLTD